MIPVDPTIETWVESMIPVDPATQIGGGSMIPVDPTGKLDPNGSLDSTLNQQQQKLCNYAIESHNYSQE